MNSRRFDTPLMMTATDIEKVFGISTGLVTAWRREHNLQYLKARACSPRKSRWYRADQIVAVASKVRTSRSRYEIPPFWDTVAADAVAETAYKSMISVRGYDLPPWSEIKRRGISDFGIEELKFHVDRDIHLVPPHLQGLVKRVLARPWHHDVLTFISISMWFDKAFLEESYKKHPSTMLKAKLPAVPELAIKPETQPEPEPIAARQDITSTATLERMVAELLAEVRTLREHVQSIATPPEPEPLQVVDRRWWRIW